MSEGQALAPYVVLLHGIGRDKRILREMEIYLTQLGYHVYNDSYLSTRYPIETLAEIVHRRVQAACPDARRVIHFVTHSMGGLIARLIIAHHRPIQLGRVVMIAPPHQGSPVVDFFKRFAFYRRRFGPAGSQIGTDENSIIHQLPPIDFELGVIAGNVSQDKLFSWWLLSGENDGKITVESTKVAGMKDHLVLPVAHAPLARQAETCQQTAYFLKHGCFRLS